LFSFYCVSTTERWEEHIAEVKPYVIDRNMVYRAWLRVKANGGAAGVDGQSIEDFGRKLEDNLYKLWNRMSSGSYFPKPVRLSPIPKRDGGQRLLGIPTVTDRVAQMVGVLYMEPKVEPAFHPDSYGYRPGKTAHDAVNMARQRCWNQDWVIDLDIKGYFDSIHHGLLMKAIQRHVQEKWLFLYIERWLTAPGITKTGEQVERECGTPQGGVISPLLANLFLHYVFDLWMRKEFESIPFERYADDIIVHCVSKKQAQYVLEAIRQRSADCGLTLHAQKTKIVYCKDGRRKGDHDHTNFTFLGYQFRTRLVRNSQTGKFFVGFTPAVSPQAKQSMLYRIRSWKLKSCATMSLEEVAMQINPIVRGWMNYYGRYCRSALSPVLDHVEMALSGWAMKKFKKLRRHRNESLQWLDRVRKASPNLFAHWTVAKVNG
jgi:RNA-directed DNA polymerase